jgi:hypothetical protein
MPGEAIEEHEVRLPFPELTATPSAIRSFNAMTQRRRSRAV